MVFYRLCVDFEYVSKATILYYSKKRQVESCVVDKFCKNAHQKYFVRRGDVSER